MLAAGMDTPAQLGKVCDVSRQTASKWLAMEEAELSGARLEAIATKLRVRLRWLVTGIGVMRAGAMREPDSERAAALMDRMTRAQCDQWFAFGEELLKQQPPPRGCADP